MPESFLKLSAKEQSEIYQALAPQLSRAPIVLEKDVWVCWALQKLFDMPEALPMVFKGGTSLSKVFRAIARFSEDIDITLDYRGFNEKFDPFAEKVSRTQRDKFSEKLKSFVSNYTNKTIAPYFNQQLINEFGYKSNIELDKDGEKMRIHYPSALESSGSYIGNSVLIEFGGRNITEPNAAHSICPDIAAHLPNLEFPKAEVKVLSPVRTFWEKATLIHVECHRPEFRSSAERLSRHWYDLALLAEHEIGHTALKNRDLLIDVVKHKKVFYANPHYDACLTGKLRLLPDDKIIVALRNDFQKMIDSGFFAEDPPTFDTITKRLRTLETTINQSK